VTITAEERRVLEECYRGCPCGGCTRRRELIAKVLGEVDRLQLAHRGAEQAWERAEKENDQLRARVAELEEHPLTVDTVRGAVLEALAPPVERTPVRSYDYPHLADALGQIPEKP
jgi:hypothetical protein